MSVALPPQEKVQRMQLLAEETRSSLFSELPQSLCNMTENEDFAILSTRSNEGMCYILCQRWNGSNFIPSFRNGLSRSLALQPSRRSAVGRQSNPGLTHSSPRPRVLVKPWLHFWPRSIPCSVTG